MNFDNKQFAIEKAYAITSGRFHGLFTDEQVADLYDTAFLAAHLKQTLERITAPATTAIELAPKDLAATFVLFSDDVHMTAQDLDLLCASINRVLDLEPYND